MEPVPAPLAGRYQLDELIATGGMGRVWRGRDLQLGRTVAVKVLRSEFSGNETFLARFRAEARHAAALAHEGIAAVHDHGEVPDPDGGGQLAFLVMDLVDGEPLSALLAREGRLDAARTLALLRQTAAALAAAHAAGVVHRDIKPANLLVAPDGRVTVTDFGIAWSSASVPLTQTGQVVGTASYLSPEQAEGRQAGPGSDVYALGMIAHECLTGRRAFDGDNAVQIALRQIRDVPDPLPDDVPDAVRHLVGRMLLKDPDARLADGAAVRAAVDDVLAGRDVPAAELGDGGTRPLALWPDVRPAAPPPRRPLRSRVLAPAVALVAGAGIALTALAVLAPAAPAPRAVAEAPPSLAAAVTVVAGELIGRPVDQVEAALASLGLRVERVAEVTGTAEPGTVLAVTPSGALARGDLVTVTFAEAPPALATSSAPSEAPAGVAGPVTAAVRVVEPAPTSAPAAGSSASSGAQRSSGSGDRAGPGGGHGKGHPKPHARGHPDGKAKHADGKHKHKPDKHKNGKHKHGKHKPKPRHKAER